MLTRLIFLTALTIGAFIFLTGAWSRSAPQFAQGSKPGFVPQAVPLDPSLIGSGIDACELLDKAIERLGWPQTTWLRTKIRQTMTDAQTQFVAEGTLQRGPHHSARMELQIQSGGTSQWVTLVSDGDVAVQITQRTRSVDTKLERLPANARDPAAKDAYLDARGCGGPVAVLKKLRPLLQETRIQTGMLGNEPVIRVQGTLRARKAKEWTPTSNPVETCEIYFDAKTLWPIQIAWLGKTRDGVPCSILRLEFLEPEINRALSLSECQQQFSYQPNAERTQP